jgi:hypothetical protein
MVGNVMSGQPVTGEDVAHTQLVPVGIGGALANATGGGLLTCTSQRVRMHIDAHTDLIQSEYAQITRNDAQSGANQDAACVSTRTSSKKEGLS